jgi:hypothetical protein
MAHYLAGRDKYRGDYQFGRTRSNHARGRAASNRINRYLKAMIELSPIRSCAAWSASLSFAVFATIGPTNSWARDSARPGVREG